MYSARVIGLGTRPSFFVGSSVCSYRCFFLFVLIFTFSYRNRNDYSCFEWELIILMALVMFFLLGLGKPRTSCG